MKSSPSSLFVTLIFCCYWNLFLAKELFVQHDRGFLFRFIVFNYEDEDIVNSVTMGSRCEEFIKKESQIFGVDGMDEADMKPHAVNICQQVAKSLQLPYDYDPEAYYANKHKLEWAEAQPTLDFFKNGWIKANNVLPELNDEELLQNILQTLKKRKFEYVIDAIYMAKKKWGFNKEEARESCGMFDESVLNEENLKNDEISEALYRKGLDYMKCAVNLFSAKYKDRFVYLPFNQVINIHRINSAVYDLATSEHLGKIAASLLQHNTVRLYQTALFLKENDSINIQTEWHRDLDMVPLDTREGGSLTFWCPLIRTLSFENDDSMLRFHAGSHRDMSREHWYGKGYQEFGTYSQAISLAVGDCTIHHGWVRHYAPPQANENSRLAIGFTYVIADATVLKDFPAETSNRHSAFKDEDEYSYRDWIKDLEEGDVIDHPLLPIVFNKLIVHPQKSVYKKKEFENDIPDTYLFESFRSERK